MCAQPLGSVLYGVLFEICKGFEYAVVLFSGIISLVIAINAGNTLSVNKKAKEKIIAGIIGC